MQRGYDKKSEDRPDLANIWKVGQVITPNITTVGLLIHFWLMFYLIPPVKQIKVFGFLVFSGGINWEHWPDIGLSNNVCDWKNKPHTCNGDWICIMVIQFTGSHRNIFLWLPVNCITKSRLLVFAWVSKFDLYLLQRVHRATTNDNEWQRVVQRVTTNDNEWQRMTTSDNEWQRVTMSDKEWQRVVQRVTTKVNEWPFQLIFLFFSNKRGAYH